MRTRRLFSVLLGAVLPSLLPTGPAAGAPAHGAFKVGVTTLTFTRPATGTGTPRSLETIIWYPAGQGGTEEALGRRDAAVHRGRFPLIVFSHGACGRPTEATFLTKTLATYGFIVAAPRRPGHTADDFPGCLTGAATIDAFVNGVPDVRFVIDAMLATAGDPASRFARRLRPEAIAMAGLSFGGFLTLGAEQQEDRLVAALVMVPGGNAALGPTPIAIPTLVIGAEHDSVVGFPESETTYDRLVGPRFLVELLAANHLSVVDDCFNHDLNLSFCVATDISQDAAHALVLRYAVPFLRRYVKGRGVAGHLLVRPVDGVRLTAEPEP
jgi:predicted dienelactone hydrolase